MSGTRERSARAGARGKSDGRSGHRSRVAEPDAESASARSALVALEEERDFLLRSIADLDRQHDKGEVADADYVELSDDYTARAARVIRLIGSGGIDAAAGAEKRPRGIRSHLSAILTVVAVLVIGGVAGTMVARSSGSTAPSDTGSAAATTGATEPGGPVADLLREARQRTAQIQSSLASGDSQGAVEAYKGAISSYDRALEIEPGNAEALTYRGWLMHNLATQSPTDMAADLDAEALDWLNRAVEADPTYPDARIFRAVLLDAAGRPAEALEDLSSVDTAALPEAMRQMVEQRRAAIEAQLGGR